MNSILKRAFCLTNISSPFLLTMGFLVMGPILFAESDLPEQASGLTSRDVAGRFVSEALQYNPGLEAYENRYQAARQTITTAGTLPNPMFQLSHFVESIQTRTGPQEQALMLQQPIPWFGKLDRKRDAARAHSEALWYAYSIQQFMLVDQVTKQVFEIAYLDKSIAITQENVQLLRQLESVVEDRVRSGGDLNDLLRLQVEIERFEDMVARQEAQLTGSTAKLEGLLGRSSSGSPFMIDWSAASSIEADLSQWLAAIRDRSPRLAMLRSLESSQEARERLAKLANRPDLSVGVNYIRTGSADNPMTSGSGRDPWALMVGVSLPIWGQANKAVALQATLEKDAITAQIKDQELQLLAEGRSLIALLEDAQNRIVRYDEKLLPLARQAKDITESAYRSGRASILDVIDSDRALLKLETEYWRAAADAWIARWKLATLSGGLWLN
jgi:cobalt-zinc-cadmium efflux system outer membrane protein